MNTHTCIAFLNCPELIWESSAFIEEIVEETDDT